jgi:TM2 domain-containing membrane protein YozV
MAACPHCGLAMADVPEMAGQLVACPSCARQFHLPSASVATAPPPPVASTGAFCRNCGAAVHPQAVACMSCGLPPRAGNKYCPTCKADTHPQAVVCVKCGVSLAKGSGFLSGRGSGVATTQSLDPTIAAVLSLFIPGLSQILMGQVVKGIVILVAAIVLTVFCLVGIVLSPVAAIDAYLIARKIQAGNQIGEWEFF